MAGTIILGFIIVIDRTAREQQVASARLQSIARDQVRVPVVFTLVLGGAAPPPPSIGVCGGAPARGACSRVALFGMEVHALP